MDDRKKYIAYLCRETENLNREIKAINNGTRILKEKETKIGLLRSLNKKKANHSKEVMQYIKEHIKNSGLEPIFLNHLMSALKDGDLVALGSKEYKKDKTENLAAYQSLKVALMVRHKSTTRTKGSPNSRELVKDEIRKDKVCYDKISLNESDISDICKQLTKTVDTFILETDSSPKHTEKGTLRLQSMPSDQEIISFIEPIADKLALYIKDRGEKILNHADQAIFVPYPEW